MRRWIIFGLTAIALPAQPQFEAASVKAAVLQLGPREGLCSFRVHPGIRGGPGSETPGQIVAESASFKELMLVAYGVPPNRVDGPIWIDPPAPAMCGMPRYDVIAKFPAGATPDDVMAMWQALLRERFGLVVKHERRLVSGAALVVAKTGAKLPMELGDCNPSAVRGIVDTMGTYKKLVVPCVVGRQQTMAQLARVLERFERMPVWDQTGLAGEYDFELRYGGEMGRPSPSMSLGAMGLRLKGARAQMDVIVVERASETPTEN